MQTQNSMFFKLSKLLVSFFGIGLIKYAPGTFGSLATIPLIYLVFYLDNLYQFIILFLFILISIPLISNVEKINKEHDSKWIVIDEVIGMYITWLFGPTQNIKSFIIIFVLFRIFDIFKPFPIGLIDRKLKTAIGTVLDDIVAGIFAGIVYFFVKLIFRDIFF